MIEKEDLILEENWDKVFDKSDQVDHKKVTFPNRFGITLAADMYIPKDVEGKLPAIAISGPFGAVKEQSSGLYAQELAKNGFLTIAFDPSFTGESGGKPRYINSPDINTEDFSAAVDYLESLGICGWGGIALAAAAMDPRIKATVASTMYDMSRVGINGYFDSVSEEERKETKKQLSAQRTQDYKNGEYQRAGGVVDPLPDDAPFFVKDYYDYYKTPRGYHKRSLNSNEGWNTTANLSYMKAPLLDFIGEIDNPVLIVHGDKAHSAYMGKDAFKELKGDNKELILIPGAVHTDLYDQIDIIPFEQITEFYKKSFN